MPRTLAATDPLLGHASITTELAQIGATFWQRGWSVGTSSNYSAVIQREPLELVITASGMDKGKLRPTDFVRIDQQGLPTSANQPKSSAETLLHIEAATADQNVGAVLHTHSIWGTLLSDVFASQAGFTIAGYEMLKGLAGISTHETELWVPIFPNTQHIPDLVSQVTAYRQQFPERKFYGYLIHKHGLYTWGQSLADARRHIEIFEFLFESVARRLQWST